MREAKWSRKGRKKGGGSGGERRSGVWVREVQMLRQTYEETRKKAVNTVNTTTPRPQSFQTHDTARGDATAVQENDKATKVRI